MSKSSSPSYKYDVALSFSGEDREVARELARLLKSHTLEVFYDEAAQADLWGKNLDVHLDEIYRYRARYCIVIASCSYIKSPWTKQELASALSAARERETDYILPIRLDDVDIPGLPSGICHLDMRVNDLPSVASMVVNKLSCGDGRQVRQSRAANESRNHPSIAAADASFENSHFVRKVPEKPRAIKDAPFVEKLLEMWPSVPAFERAKWAYEVLRVLGHREHWGLKLSYPYTCWRTATRFYLSTLPEFYDFKPQTTFEFTIIEGDTPRLMLSGIWQPGADEWQGFAVSEFHNLFRDLWADRSGCSMVRETFIHLAKHKGWQFLPPVVPGLGETEELCGWIPSPKQFGLFDWDRDPILTGCSIVCEETYFHRESECALHVFTIQGGWRNAAFFEFYDILERTIPGRFNHKLLDRGCLRVAIFLWTGEVPTEAGSITLCRLNLAILRMVAAERGLPIKQEAEIPELRLPSGSDLRAFSAALDNFGERQFVHCGEKYEWFSDDSPWWKLAHTPFGERFFMPFVSLSHGIWGASYEELELAVQQAAENASQSLSEGRA